MSTRGLNLESGPGVEGGVKALTSILTEQGAPGTPGRAHALAPGADDAQLVRAFLAGDQEAFARLVRRHQALVVSLVRRYAAGPDEVADLAQTAFLKALEATRRTWGRASPDTPLPFRAWLARVALNVGRSHGRTRLRWRLVPVDALAEAGTADPGADEQLERAEARRAVHAAVLGLSRRQREVFALRVDGALPFHDIALALGITENNAKVQFHLAVKRLKGAVGGGAEETSR